MKKWKNYVLAFLAIIIVFLLLKGCYNKAVYQGEVDVLNNKLAKQQAQLTITVRKDSSKLYQMEQKLMGEQQARLQAEKAAKRFKTLSAVVKTTVAVKRDTVWVPFADTIFVTGADSVAINRPVTYADKWFYLGGSVKPDGLLLDSLGFNPGYVNVLIGQQRRGLFKKALPVVELQIENPYMHVTQANNVIVKNNTKKPILLSNTAMLIYGFVLGFAITR